MIVLMSPAEGPLLPLCSMYELGVSTAVLRLAKMHPIPVKCLCTLFESLVMAGRAPRDTAILPMQKGPGPDGTPRPREYAHGDSVSRVFLLLRPTS